MTVGTAGGTPTLALDIGSPEDAVYTDGSGSNRPVLSYTVAENDEDAAARGRLLARWSAAAR